MVEAGDHDNPGMARLRGALERELGPDEAVRWHGWQLGSIDVRLFASYLFAVPWTAFALAWTGIAAGAVASMGDDGPGLIAWAFPLFGVPFIAVGGWMLSRPFVPLWQRGRVLYVVTDSRVLKLTLGRELTIEAVPAARIGLTERRERADGSGMINLAIKIGRDSDGDRQTERFVFGPVADVMGAQAALHDIARGGVVAGAISS
ncbi:MAG: hypothetical protein KAF27_11025 [Porphyrobacter sp.]|nr:hypothetical protein [Porphyrobacter sp.]